MVDMKSWSIAVLALALLSVTRPAVGREIVDMAGRHVTIPDKIAKVYGSSPPVTLLLYALAPDYMIGLNTPYATNEPKLLRKDVAALPALGSQAGMGRQFNPEEVVSRRPDLVIAWLDRFVDTAKAEASFAKIGLPVVFIKLDTLAEYPAAFRFLGALFDRTDRAEQLARYIETAQARVAKAVDVVPSAQRLRVYYAEGPDGLATECDKSFHAEPITLAGGDNVRHCASSTHVGMEKISLEQVIALKPDLILAQDRTFAKGVLTNANWRNVPAVAQKRVVYVPHAPFNWLDRPPSYMRALGVQWLANLFYPSRYAFDLNAEARTFYKLFLGVEIDDGDITRIMN
ncbi:MAG: ABC transporter substrate-binding protein [Methylocystis sp.]|uniref:ABC transporter substrate-binding protein n=1 Tax=Methylocystis sp. TaxID=1911079 RepID=UPI003D0B71F7